MNKQKELSGFAIRLKLVMQALGYNQPQLAARLGVPLVTISKVLIGAVQKSMTIADALTEKLNVNSHYLLTGDGPMFLYKNDVSQKAIKDSAIPVIPIQSDWQKAHDIDFVSTNAFILDPKIDQGKHIAVIVNNTAMQPTVRIDGVVIAKELGSDLLMLPVEQLVGIELKNGQNIFCRLKHLTKGLLEAYFENPSYPPIELSAKDIKGYWQAVKVINTM